MPGPLVGILLAAGQGSRFGSDKLLQPLADGTPLAVAVAAARRLRPACDRLLVVLRPGSDILAGWLAAEGGEILFCPEAAEGMGRSLAAGVLATPEAAAWLVALADMPFIAEASHRAVAASLRAGASLAAASFNGRRGHPVGFASHWRASLAALRGDGGGRSILAAHRHALVLTPLDDPGILRDIDRPADLPGYSPAPLADAERLPD